VFGGDGDAGLARRGFGARGEGLCWGATGERPVGADGVVVGAEAVELGLQPGDGGWPALLGEPLLEGLVEAFETLPQVWGW